jgi:hypothetical protein
VLRVRADERDEFTAVPALRGLAANPGGSAEILLQLLQTHPDVVSTALRRRAALPALVFQAMLHHPLRVNSYPRRPERCDIRA